MIPPLTLSGLYSLGGTGGGAATAGGAAAMGPVGWTMLGLGALGSLAGLFGNKQQQTPQFPEAVKVGAKPVMGVGNPYQTPMATTGLDPYGQTMNPLMRRQPMLSSALARYGGLG